MTKTFFSQPKFANMPPPVWILMDKQLGRRPSNEKSAALLETSQGKIDVIGDIHANYNMLLTLLSKMGWTWTGTEITHPDPQRKLVLIGDIIDGGEDNINSLRLAKAIMETDKGTVLMGNHDWQFLAWLKGVMPDAPHNGTMDQLIEEWQHISAKEQAEITTWLETVADLVRFEHPIMGEVELVHGAPADVVPHMPAWLTYDEGGELHARMFGLPHLEADFKVRNVDWRPYHKGERWTISGHQPLGDIVKMGKTIYVDIGSRQGMAGLRLDKGVEPMEIFKTPPL